MNGLNRQQDEALSELTMVPHTRLADRIDRAAYMRYRGAGFKAELVDAA